MDVIVIRPADFRDPADLTRVVDMVDSYARDPMGGGEGLSPAIKARLPAALAAHPTAFALLALDGAAPVGVAVCVQGLSTFAARPTVNLHDLAVATSHRGCGLGRRLLAAVGEAARQRDACKITLEVRPDNAVGRHLYTDCGFELAGLADQAYLMMEKPL